MASEEPAGLAFEADVIILDPAASANNDHHFISVLADNGYDGTLLILDRPMHQLAARRMAATAGLKHVDRLPVRYALAHIVPLLNRGGRQPVDGDACDRLFISWLIQQGRLLPNLTHEFHAKLSLRDNLVRGYKTLTRLRNRRALNPELIFAPSTILSLEVAASLLAVEAAAKLLSAQVKDGRGVPIAVNCSPAVLADGAFIGALPVLLRRHSVSAGKLAIEITEIDPFDRSDRLLEHIKALVALRVPLALGVSMTDAQSFNRITDLPVSEIKIDRKVFRGCVNGELPRTVVQDIVQQCRVRGISSVLDGIETDDDLLIARTIGADYGQGFYWGKPLPPRALTANYPA